MDSDKSELRWGVAQRLEFIEFRLSWEGHVNRSDLMEQFGLSVNQAFADLNRYIGFDGFRWHTRAFCQMDGVFKDFLLPRIISYPALLRHAEPGRAK